MCYIYTVTVQQGPSLPQCSCTRQIVCDLVDSLQIAQQTTADNNLFPHRRHEVHLYKVSLNILIISSYAGKIAQKLHQLQRFQLIGQKMYQIFYILLQYFYKIVVHVWYFFKACEAQNQGVSTPFEAFRYACALLFRPIRIIQLYTYHTLGQITHILQETRCPQFCTL